MAWSQKATRRESLAWARGPISVGATYRESTEGGTRTLTPLRELDFESSASANSATSAFGVMQIVTTCELEAKYPTGFWFLQAAIGRSWPSNAIFLWAAGEFRMAIEPRKSARSLGGFAGSEEWQVSPAFQSEAPCRGHAE